ncbi:NAD+ synthase [Candidatus Micrarchaeota archaeon]|nr:NAD+ synthase [Candidatus Micrarchaeota archaeon]
MEPQLEQIKTEIVTFISSTVGDAGANGVVVGLSGGIDSSLVATLCVRALGKEKVLGLIMPEEHQKDGGHTMNAVALAEKLGIEHKLIVISPMVAELEKHLPKNAGELSKANIRPRVRMALLYEHSNALNLLVAGTGNKSEETIGYFTKWGDGGVDFLPIGNLYKTHVRALARQVGVPQGIIDAPPTAGLWHGQTDEGEMGVSYEKLDRILYCLVELKLTEKGAAEKSGEEFETVRKVAGMMRKAGHKLRVPPVCKVRAPRLL